ncbi:MAG: alpha/beta hydrolase [Gammaproteobacteria bacterium]|jgi:pimeloyl-ACP methyl ester carboxylesterase|nr:alpha/beta hydrolase [Gammaproteobacteria bacterium]
MNLETIAVGPARRTVYYYRRGHGQPLLYLHHMLGIVGFEPLLAKLAESFDVIAPYAPGWGPAKDQLEDIDPGALDITLHNVDLLNALGVKSAHVMGISIGAWMGAELAAIAPQRVLSLTLVNPLGLWLDGVECADPFAQHPGMPSEIQFSERGLRKSLLLEGRDKMDAHVEELLNLRASAKFLWPIPDTGISRRLGRIEAPTLIATSEKDPIVPAAHGVAWRDAIAGSRLTTIAQAGHLAGLEQPEACAALASDFVRDHAMSAVA